MEREEQAIRALPFVSIRGRVYVDRDALLDYLRSLATPPEPPAIPRKAMKAPTDEQPEP